MAKVTGPLFSLDAHGTIGPGITFREGQTGTHVYAKSSVKQRRTECQGVMRDIFTACSLEWDTFSWLDKLSHGPQDRFLSLCMKWAYRKTDCYKKYHIPLEKSD